MRMSSLAIYKNKYASQRLAFNYDEAKRRTFLGEFSPFGGK
jgi:hypothetical protein